MAKIGIYILYAQQWGAADAEIEVPSVESIERFLFLT